MNNKKQKDSKKVYGVSIPANQQPIRKHRRVFTHTIGFFKKKRYIALDIDEMGLTYRDKSTMASNMYISLDEIVIDERTLQLTVRRTDFPKEPFMIDILKLDGDSWDNFQIIKSILEEFATTNNVELVYFR